MRLALPLLALNAPYLVSVVGVLGADGLVDMLGLVHRLVLGHVLGLVLGLVLHVILGNVLDVGVVDRLSDVLGHVLGLVLLLVLGLVHSMVDGLWHHLLLVDCVVHRQLRHEAFINDSKTIITL